MSSDYKPFSGASSASGHTSGAGETASARAGYAFGIAAYALWGLLPIYWKLVKSVSATELIAHRILWSFLSLMLVILVMGQGRALRQAVMQVRVVLVYGAAALLIAANWLTYVWSVNAGHVVECSLGYFINPLFNVLVGVIFLRERLRVGQWASIALAASGVAYLTWSYGTLPWVALLLASTFAIYGLIKKLAPLGALYGLTLETGLLFVPALIFLAAREATGSAAFLQVGAGTTGLLLLAGPVTTIPLLLFASSAQRLSLTALGVLQYLSPTLALLLGVFAYGEAFSRPKQLGFGLVWLALALFAVEGMMARRRRQPAPADPSVEPAA